MTPIAIDNDKTLGMLLKQFNDEYPFLKIEFLGNGQLMGIKKFHSPVFFYNRRISEMRNNKRKRKIYIRKDTKVSELEKLFSKEFGLYIQVLRKSGRVWLETTFTNNWTLEQQNAEGRDLHIQFLKD